MDKKYRFLSKLIKHDKNGNLRFHIPSYLREEFKGLEGKEFNIVVEIKRVVK